MNVHLFETLDEARQAGARIREGRLTTPDGYLAMSVGQYPRAYEGLRVFALRTSEAATRHYNFRRVHEALLRIQLKTLGDPT